MANQKARQFRVCDWTPEEIADRAAEVYSAALCRLGVSPALIDAWTVSLRSRVIANVKAMRAAKRAGDSVSQPRRTNRSATPLA